MLRVVRKNFESDNGVHLKPGDIVDDSTWKHARALFEHGYTGETDAIKPTVDPSSKPTKKAKSPASAKKDKPKRKRSALVRQPRVFS